MRMCVLLCCEDFGNAHVCQLLIGKWIIPRYCKFLACLHMVEHDLYHIFECIRCLHLFLIIHQVSGIYLAVPNVDPVHQFHKILGSIPHH